MDKEQNQINELDFRVFMAETVLYRKEQGHKLEEIRSDLRDIAEKLNLLPCRERSKYYDWYSSQIKVLWVFVSGIVMAIIATWFKHE